MIIIPIIRHIFGCSEIGYKPGGTAMAGCFTIIHHPRSLIYDAHTLPLFTMNIINGPRELFHQSKYT